MVLLIPLGGSCESGLLGGGARCGELRVFCANRVGKCLSTDHIELIMTAIQIIDVFAPDIVPSNTSFRSDHKWDRPVIAAHQRSGSDVNANWFGTTFSFASPVLAS